MSDEPEDETVAAAADQLYALPPDEFTAARAELVTAAKADGDADAAKAIEKLRKPTLPASIVNRYVHAHADATARLTDLGDRLRRATRELDATLLRELSTERRTLVAELTSAALDEADAPATQRDEVSSTFDAAVADPDVTARLGWLLRPEHFSGFGVAPGPELTLVQGGSSRRPKKAAAKKAPGKKAPAKKAPNRRLVSAAEKARDVFADADERSTAAEAGEQRAHEQVKRLTDELDQLQRELDDAKLELDRAHRESRTAKSIRRQARSALDRAERQLET